MEKEKIMEHAKNCLERDNIGEEHPYHTASYLAGYYEGYSTAEADITEFGECEKDCAKIKNLFDLDLGIELKLPKKIAWTEFAEDSIKLHYSTQDEFEKCSNRKILGIDKSRPVGAQVMWLGVDFKYEEDKILAYDVLGEPITGNQIYLKILGQEFVENFEVLKREKDEIYRREMAFMFGKKLQEIGNNISNQAKYGKPTEIVINDKKIISF